jgi:hypothetical protein
MPAKDERRELVPAIVAANVAAIGVFFLWADLRNDLLGRGGSMVRSAVVSRAGAIVAPSEPPAYLVVQQSARRVQEPITHRPAQAPKSMRS